MLTSVDFAHARPIMLQHSTSITSTLHNSDHTISETERLELILCVYTRGIIPGTV